MFAAHSANPHLAAAAVADPYNVSNTLHNFQTSQVSFLSILKILLVSITLHEYQFM
jgi:hypothetical protein